MNKSGPIIFTFKNRALGDAIISLGAIQYLKTNFPNSFLIYGVPAWVYPLFKNVETAADKIIPVSLKNFSDWINFYGVMKNLNPDIIIELFQSGRGKKFGSFYEVFNHSTYFGNNHHLDDGTFKKSNIQRDIDGIRHHLKNLPEASFLDFCPKLKSNFNISKENTIIFGIVATRETKLWPIEYYHQLARIILNNFPFAKIKIPVSPNKLDQNLKKTFLSLGVLDRVEFLETSLEVLPLKISQAKYYIGNDTGIKHLAIALGLKSASFFGPEPAVEWHPYNIPDHPFYYVDNLDCRTKVSHFCGLNTCDSMICLNQIKPETVFDSLKKRLEEALC